MFLFEVLADDDNVTGRVASVSTVQRCCVVGVVCDISFFVLFLHRTSAKKIPLNWNLMSKPQHRLEEKFPWDTRVHWISFDCLHGFQQKRECIIAYTKVSQKVRVAALLGCAWGEMRNVLKPLFGAKVITLLSGRYDEELKVNKLLRSLSEGLLSLFYTYSGRNGQSQTIGNCSIIKENISFNNDVTYKSVVML